jgi:hypothetical protein
MNKIESSYLLLLWYKSHIRVYTGNKDVQLPAKSYSQIFA